MLRIGTLLLVLSMTRSDNIESRINISNRFNHSRIVGGQNAYIRNFPHQVSLLYYGTHLCGGSIYKRNKVITAAHCLEERNLHGLEVAAGSSFVITSSQVVPVKKFIKHNQFNSESGDYDIAILVLSKCLKFNKNVKPIALLKSRPPPPSKVIATGWGSTNYLVFSPHLQKVQVEVVDQDDCEKLYLEVGIKISPTMICAGDANGGKDSCQGDSGGPLMYGKLLLGVVSWGVGCGVKGYPGVYASIPDLYDWVVKTVLKN